MNYDEINRDFRRRYDVFNLPFYIRIPIGFVLLLWSTVCLVMVLYFIENLTDPGSQLLEILNLICVIPAFILSFMIFSKIALGMILHRTRKVTFSLKALMEKGQFYDAEVTEKTARRLEEQTLRYQFQNAKGRKITGIDRYGDYGFKIVDKMLVVNPEVVHRPIAGPKHVKVWYANDKIHTVL